MPQVLFEALCIPIHRIRRENRDAMTGNAARAVIVAIVEDEEIRLQWLAAFKSWLDNGWLSALRRHCAGLPRYPPKGVAAW